MRRHLRPLVGGLVLSAAVGLAATATAGPALTGTARFQASAAGAKPAASHLHCDVELQAGGRAYRSRPVVHGGVLTVGAVRVQVRRSGRSGTLSWYTGVVRGDALATAGGDRRVGVAVFPAPSRDGTAAKRWAVAQISLEAYATTSPMSAKDRRERVRVQDASAGELGREARSLRLVSGRAHATAGTRAEPAAS